MQIPPASSASQAAGILAQSASKDKTSAMDANASAGRQSTAPPVEKSESTDQDRDAQGQSDGFSGRRKPRPDDDILDVDHRNESVHRAPLLLGEPPSELDIVG